jgi:hypothetical protein
LEDRFFLVKMVLSQRDLHDLVCKTTAQYNRYRSPEATAKLVAVSGEMITVAFSGAFCYSCGVEAYFEDFIYELKRLTDKVGLAIGEVRQGSAGSFEVDYLFKPV